MMETAASRPADDKPRQLGFAPREVLVEKRSDGTLVLRSPIEFVDPEWTILDFFPIWAERAPNRVFLAQRDGGMAWRTISFATMWQQAQSVAQGMTELGAKPGDKLAILSGNSIENAVIYFAAMLAKIVVAPISPNYSLLPGGLSRLRDIMEILQPSLVFVQDSDAYGNARGVERIGRATWISADGKAGSIGLETLGDTTAAGDAIARLRAIDRDAVAKILFTSGSTGLPKGVINTHKMMASSLEMTGLMIEAREAPVQVEWLPWHHTMGGNVILHGILKNGGTLYIDEGRPVPQLFSKTIANLREVSPTSTFNVPAGYDLLCDALEADAELRKNFFRRLDRMSYAGSAISQTTLENLYRLGRLTTGRSIPVTSGYGTTETAPTISNAHWAIEQPGELGLPAPGLELKLVPVTDTYEVRVKGPNVTPGYFGQPDLTKAAFDEEGFYRIGDTVSFIDRVDPNLGLRFTGRLSENFKLSNGTWVVVSRLRTALLNAAGGLLQDVVIVGENREACAILGWLNPTKAKEIAAEGVDDRRNRGVLDHLIRSFREHNSRSGSSERIRAFILLQEPPSLAAGEITDKAYVNQRIVLTNRAALAERLYASTEDDEVTFLLD
jgi:feruloyl-CoA synthase